LVQVRENNLEPVARRKFAIQVTETMRDVDGIVVINSDACLAAALGAGLHMPSRQLMTTQSRPDFEWCSASCHDIAELDKAHHLGLDFVLLGPVYATPSHAGVLGLGWTTFADLIRQYPLPVFALGGMRLANMHDARRMGAHGVAMLRGAWELDQG
jgi:8-oxo-dGTP diphosphatase